MQNKYICRISSICLRHLQKLKIVEFLLICRHCTDLWNHKFAIVLQVINDGPLNAPAIVDGTTTYKINANNGNFGYLDQANPNNTDIIPKFSSLPQKAEVLK